MRRHRNQPSEPRSAVTETDRRRNSPRRRAAGRSTLAVGLPPRGAHQAAWRRAPRHDPPDPPLRAAPHTGHRLPSLLHGRASKADPRHWGPRRTPLAPATCCRCSRPGTGTSSCRSRPQGRRSGQGGNGSALGGHGSGRWSTGSATYCYWCVKTIQCPPWNMYVPLVDILSRSSHLWMPRIWVVGTWSEASRVFYICFDLPLCVPEGDPRIPDDGSCIRHLDLLVSFFYLTN